MKKIILFITYCLMATTQHIYAQTVYGKIFLQHAGNVTNTFAYDEMGKAVEAAADGDTLFLSKGSFRHEEQLYLNKSICIIGSGISNSSYITSNNATQVSGSIIIEEGNNKTTPSVILEGFSLDDLCLQGNVDNLIVKKCFLSHIRTFSSSNDDISAKNIELDRCSIYNLEMFNLSGNTFNLTSKNCMINYIAAHGPSTASIKFINCNVRRIHRSAVAMFVNSIINQVGDGLNDYLNGDAMLVNTLYHSLNGLDPMENTPQQDCWTTTDNIISNDNGQVNSVITAEQLKAAGYLGVDGTIIGIEGGVNPFSFTLHSPSINSNNATVDLNNKKVIINVNVTAN